MNKVVVKLIGLDVLLFFGDGLFLEYGGGVKGVVFVERYVLVCDVDKVLEDGGGLGVVEG